MSGLTLDAGALIAIERSDRRTIRMIEVTRGEDREIAIPAGVLGQVWREGAKQARLARLLAYHEVTIAVLDGPLARAAGALCGARRTADVIDASVVLCARARGHVVLTSDPEDLRRLDPELVLIVV